MALSCNITPGKMLRDVRQYYGIEKASIGRCFAFGNAIMPEQFLDLYRKG